jgi:hypothetical protein
MLNGFIKLGCGKTELHLPSSGVMVNINTRKIVVNLQSQLNRRVKYVTASCGFKSLFFSPCAFIFIIGGTCAMGKDGDGTSIHFSVQN